MEDNRFVMVSEWMSNGNITEFLKDNDTADRLQLVFTSFRILSPRS